MSVSSVLVHSALFALAALVAAAPAHAQSPIEGEGSMQVGNATFTIGGGAAIMDLPDVPSLMFKESEFPIPAQILETFKSSEDFGDEIGWNVNGSVAVPVGANGSVSLNGFWATIDDEGFNTCSAPNVGTNGCGISPLIDDPAAAEFVGGAAPVQIDSRSERDVDLWGVSLEFQQQLTPGVSGVTRAPPRHILAFGADIRGIDQDLKETLVGTAATLTLTGTYDEELGTRYYGAYVAWGGDFPGLFPGGLLRRWGLHSAFRLRGGLYYAETDYEGRLVAADDPPNRSINNTLSLSNDETAFIGGLVLETKKRIGRRAALSLKSEYEYYSYVPVMAYNQEDVRPGFPVLISNAQIGTVIGKDNAYSLRSSLRLTIGLGPRELYQ